MGFKYTGVDPYDILIDKAKEAWVGEKYVKFIKANIFNLPFDDKSYDYVVCNNVVLHFVSRTSHKIVWMTSKADFVDER